ncbi:hypothetical protein HY994_00800 [Candidatus Micrarchaeota archaeon]|nr:hypothetical protein [Candidatus Micrarchaeota archaeon]
MSVNSGLQGMEQNRLREQGLLLEMREIQQMAESRIFASRARQRSSQLMEREKFERQQEEKQVADLALREGKMSIWMEYKQQQVQAERLQKIQEFKDMFTHVELEKELKNAYKKTHAAQLSAWVHEQIMAHPETLELLKEKDAIRTLGNRMFIGKKAMGWAVWSGRHRLQILDLIHRHEGDMERIKSGYRAWLGAPSGNIRLINTNKEMATWAAMAKKRIQNAFQRKNGRPTNTQTQRRKAA